VVTYLSIIGKLLRELEVPVLFVGSGRGGRVLQRSAVVARPLLTNNTGTSNSLRSLPIMDKYVTTDD